MIQPIKSQKVEYSKICEGLGTGMKSVIYEISMVSFLNTPIFPENS